MRILNPEPKRHIGNPPSSIPARKAGIFQVAATMVCGIFAIGAKGTWNKDGVTVTFAQVVIAALITLIVLVLGPVNNQASQM